MSHLEELIPFTIRTINIIPGFIFCVLDHEPDLDHDLNYFLGHDILF
jgi:hypothetical protein